jgi:hypothetical protein
MRSNTIKIIILNSVFYVPYLKEGFKDNLYLILDRTKLPFNDKLFMISNNELIEHLFDDIVWDKENEPTLDFAVGWSTIKDTQITVVASSKIHNERGIFIDSFPDTKNELPPLTRHYKYNFKTLIKDSDKSFCKPPSILIDKRRESCTLEPTSTNNMCMEFYSSNIQDKVCKWRNELPCGKIILLCGFRDFKNEFVKAEKMLTLSGNIVLNVFQFELTEDETECNNIKELLSLNLIMKIDMVDEIFVIDLDGCVDIETKKLISYALTKKKHIRYLTNYSK